MLNSIKNKDLFQELYSNGEKYVSPYFILYVLENNENILEYGITVTKRIGNSVIRNRVKRVYREAIRFIYKNSSNIKMKIVIVARKKTLTASLEDIKNSLSKIVSSR